MTRRRRALSRFVVAALVAVVAMVAVDVASGTSPGWNGLLVYVSDRDQGDAELYMGTYEMTLGNITYRNSSPCSDPAQQPPGTVLVETRLTNSSGADLNPELSSGHETGEDFQWSWDVAFDRDWHGNRDIYVLKLTAPPWLVENRTPEFLPVVDGPPQRLTFHESADHSPAWDGSGPGSRIAFVSERDGNPEIYVMNGDGSGQDRVTFNAAGDGDPAWSPDGDLIAFTSDRSGSRELYTVPAGGGSAVQITEGPAPKRNPNWFRFLNLVPDPPLVNDNLILFDSPRIEFGGADESLVDTEIYYVDADGANQRHLGGHPAEETNPTWSPYGDCVGFDSDRSGRRQVHVMRSDGSHLRQVTDTGRNWDPSWQSRPFSDSATPNPVKLPNATGVTCTRTVPAGGRRLVGTPGNDVLCGRNRGERIYGRGGNDIVSGGSGGDYLSGGAGRDRIYGADGQRDRIAGGRGSDVATVDRRRDLVRSIEHRRSACASGPSQWAAAAVA